MRKILLLLAIIWRITVYSGDSGRITFTAHEEPHFIHQGRWITFRDVNNALITISGSATVIIRQTQQ